MKSKQHPYLRDGRLADVMALIQVLALDSTSHRSPEGCRAELQRLPLSGAADWKEIALQHPEFFRVNPRPDCEHCLSLVTRHVMQKEGDEQKRPPLQSEYTYGLLQLCIELHDREVEQSQRWKVWLPLGLAVVAGLFTIAAALIKF